MPADDHLRARVTPAQSAGLTDMDAGEFRASAHRVVDLLADYLEDVERYAVFPPIEPGNLRPLFEASPPERPSRSTTSSPTSRA